MRAAGLPEPFVETIETGWWTTCLEVVPPRERARGAYHVYREAMPAGFAAAGAPAGPPTRRAATDDGRPVVSLFGTALFPPRLWVYSNFHCNLACDYCVVASSPSARKRQIGAERFAALVDEAVRGGLHRALPDRRRAVRAPGHPRADRARERPHDDGRADERDALHGPPARRARAPRRPPGADAAVLDRRRERAHARPLARRRLVGARRWTACATRPASACRCASR